MNRRDLLASLPALGLPAERIRVVSGVDNTGKKDVTQDLQRAINRALKQGQSLYIPGGHYKISAPLVIGNGSTNSDWVRGFHMFGDNGSDPSGPCGTLIELTTGGQRSIITVNREGGYRYFLLENIGLSCSHKSHPTYGVEFASSEISSPVLRRVVMSNVGTCIAMLAGSGQNGEFGLVENCDLTGDSGIFLNTTTAGYMWTFRHCTGGLCNTGGIAFNLSAQSGQRGSPGLRVLDTSMSFDTTALLKISNTTFLQSTGGTYGPLVVEGGRYEGITCLLRSTDKGSSGFTPIITFRDMNITCDFDPTNSHLALPAFIDVAGDGLELNLENNLITSAVSKDDGIAWKGTAPIHFNTGASPYARFKARGNIWSGFANVYIAPGSGGGGSVEMDDFLQEANNPDPTVAEHGTNFSSRVTFTPGKRKPWATSGLAPSGIPSNLIVAPHITSGNGTGLGPASPWTLNSGTISAYDTTQDQYRPTSQSPFAKTVVLRPGQSLSQVLRSSLSKGGQICWVLYAKPMGQADCTFSITDSASGEVYDQLSLTKPNLQQPMLITLMRRVASGAFPVITIANTDASNELILDLFWQYASCEADPAWSDSTEGPNLFGRPYDVVAQSVMVGSTLLLPGVAAAMRRTNSNYAAEGPAEIYVETDHANLTWRNGRTFQQAPNQDTGPEPPVDGEWPLGWIRWNSSPSPGGSIGWVCVAAGSPGVWKTFGLIGA